MIETIENLTRHPHQDLSGEELTAVAGRVAGRPELWSGHVSHDPLHRTYRQLLRDENLDVWLICWSHDHDTGFHDHDLSAGAVAVVAGAVREERLVLGRPVDSPIARTAGAGATFSFAASDIHRVLHAGAEPAVTIHAYSPPLVRMGSYEVQPTGQLRRHAVSYEEELRQVDAAAG
jgi:predicted metal-dependent enzyme (double-stranded beta helix superfamily)